jgi:hypothetical protein
MNFKINPGRKLALVLGANKYVKEIAQKTGQQIQPLIPLLVGKVGCGHHAEAARILGKTETAIVTLVHCGPERIIGIPRPNDERMINLSDSLIETFEKFGSINIPVDAILEMAKNKDEKTAMKLFEFILGMFTPVGHSVTSPSDKYEKPRLEEIIQIMRYRYRKAAERFYLPDWVRYKNVIFIDVDKAAESALAAVLYVILGQEVRGYPLENKVFVLSGEPAVLRYLKRSSRDTYQLLRKHCVVIPFLSNDFAEYVSEKYGLVLDEASPEDKEIVEFQMGQPPQEVENYINHFIDYLLSEDEVKDKDMEDKIDYISRIVREIFYYYDEVGAIIRRKLFK